MERAPRKRLGRRSVGLAIAALLAVACGENGDQRPAQAPRRAPRTTTEQTAPVTTTPSTTTEQTTPEITCEQPNRPVYVSSIYSRLPDPGAPPEGESLDLLSGTRLPDTDADGNADAVHENGLQIDLVRGDGTVTLSREGGSVFSIQGQKYVGDLDGDGRDDLLVGAYTGSHAEGIYVISGTVAPGRHDPADVGVRIATSPQNVLERWLPVGDQDGDGAADLSRGKAELYSGRKLMAPGPGKQLDRLPKPFRRFKTPWVGVLQLNADHPPVFVEAKRTGDVAELHVLTDPVICLRTDTIPVPASTGFNGLPQSGHVSAFMSGSDRIVSFSYSERSSAAVYMWNLGPAPPSPPKRGSAKP